MDVNNYKKWAWSYAKPFWHFFPVLLIFSILVSATTLILPFGIKIFADYIFGNQEVPSRLSSLDKDQLLTYTTAVFLGLYVFRSLVFGLNSWVLTRMQQKVDRQVMLDSFLTLSSVPFNNPKRLSEDDSLYLINNQARQVSRYIFGNFALFSRWMFTLVGSVLILSTVSMNMATASGVLILLVWSIAAYTSQRLQVKGEMAEISSQETHNFIEDSIKNLRLVQEYAKEKLQLVKLEAKFANRDKKHRIINRSNQLYYIFTVTLLCIVAAEVLIQDGRNLISGLLTLGDLLLFIGFLAIIFEPLTKAASAMAIRREQVKTLRELASDLEQAKAFKPKSGKKVLPLIKGKMELRNVSLQGTYKLIFTDLNLLLEPQTTVAVIGASGSGKSSLLSLFNGFMSPTTGEVLLDDISLSELDQSFLRRNVAVVDQESLVMHDTIGNNIAFSDPDRPNNLPDIMAAAVVNNAAEFINTLDKKYDTMVEEDLLSGGQKQRISVARAYYAKTPIVIMDEPTAALDRRSAEIFADELFKYFGNRSVLVATHDLALLKKVNKVYILQDKVLVPVPDLSKLDLEKYRIVT